jgi:chaperonin GroES
MNIRPLHDRVIVKKIEDTENKLGSIYIPDSAKEKPQQGEVKAAGTGRLSEAGERVPMEVKAGDRILFGKYGGSEVKVDGEEWLILREDEILGVLE